MNRRAAVICIVLFVVICGCIAIRMTQTAEKPTETAVSGGVILLDPGHGGFDGGTVADDGTLEKNINLAVALDLQDMLRVWGYPVDMTRDTDVSIHDADCVTVREKKTSDMYNRLALYEQADMIIAIHQNHYPEPKYHGAQVFYSGNHTQGQPLAAAVQQRIVELVQPENTRQIKKATDGIFLLHHTKRPAILVECGFLSNTAEREQLKSPDYRQKLAYAVLAGYWTYLSQE